MTHDAEALAAALRSGTLSAEAQARLEAAAHDPEEMRAVVHALNRNHFDRHPDDASRVKGVLKDVESLGATNKIVACCMMPYVWELASDVLGAHDVTDAADLWLVNNDDPRIEMHVRSLADRGESAETREHFQRLVERVSFAFGRRFPG